MYLRKHDAELHSGQLNTRSGVVLVNQGWSASATLGWAAKIAVAVLLVGGAAAPAHASSILTIIPEFSSSITLDPNASFIETGIYNAIAFYEDNFTTDTSAPINVSILFQEGADGVSNLNLIKFSYQSFITALTAASSGDLVDMTVLANLPTGSTGPLFSSPTINLDTVEARALGLAYSGFAGNDATVGINTDITSPGSQGTSGQYTLVTDIERSINTILGAGLSDLGKTGAFYNDPTPADLFRYSAPGVRSFSANTNCATAPPAYLSFDGQIAYEQFNNCNGGNYAFWQSNPRPSSVGAQVDDAFPAAGTSPMTTSSVEAALLDAIGYNPVQSSAGNVSAPEPGSSLLFGTALIALFIGVKRKA